VADLSICIWITSGGRGTQGPDAEFGWHVVWNDNGAEHSLYHYCYRKRRKLVPESVLHSGCRSAVFRAGTVFDREFRFRGSSVQMGIRLTLQQHDADIAVARLMDPRWAGGLPLTAD